jgi:hypothetical protein
MTYGNVPIIRRDLKEIISRSQKVCYINLNWEHHQGYETILVKQAASRIACQSMERSVTGLLSCMGLKQKHSSYINNNIFLPYDVSWEF